MYYHNIKKKIHTKLQFERQRSLRVLGIDVIIVTSDNVGYVGTFISFEGILDANG
jgi:hypothetical protein